MAEPIIKIKRDRLTKLLQRAYEIGSTGWPELAEETAEKLVEDCIAELPQNPVGVPRKEEPMAKPSKPDTFSGWVEKAERKTVAGPNTASVYVGAKKAAMPGITDVIKPPTHYYTPGND